MCRLLLTSGLSHAVAFGVCYLTPVSLLHYYPLLSRLSPPPLSTPWCLFHCSLTTFQHLFRIHTSDHRLPHGKQISLTLGCSRVSLYAAQVIAKAQSSLVFGTLPPKRPEHVKVRAVFLSFCMQLLPIPLVSLLNTWEESTREQWVLGLLVLFDFVESRIRFEARPKERKCLWETDSSEEFLQERARCFYLWKLVLSWTFLFILGHWILVYIWVHILKFTWILY